MIELAGITLAWETIACLLAFAGSEVIGSSKLKENSILQIIKTGIKKLTPEPTHKDKVQAVIDASQALKDAVASLQQMEKTDGK